MKQPLHNKAIIKKSSDDSYLLLFLLGIIYKKEPLIKRNLNNEISILFCQKDFIRFFTDSVLVLYLNRKIRYNIFRD